MENILARNKVLALFDMDGVLYNSMPNHARAWQDSMASYGIEMSLEEGYLYEGMRGVDTIKLVAKRQWGREVTDDEAREMYKRKSEYFAEYTKDCPAPLIAGVKELQQTMKSLGMTIGVVTGSGQPTLLNRIKNDFQGLVSPEVFVNALNVFIGKPAPDPYLKGIEMASAYMEKEIAARETIVVENAPLGVQSGHAAGCFTVAVNTGPLPDSALLDAGADVLFHSMEEFKNTLLSSAL